MNQIINFKLIKTVTKIREKDRETERESYRENKESRNQYYIYIYIEDDEKIKKTKIRDKKTIFFP